MLRADQFNDMGHLMKESIVDKYCIIAELGHGGMADVYLAAARGPGGFAKLLVLKVMQSHLARDEQFLTMFRDEARLAARLNHPHVVQTYETGEDNNRYYIAMEYLEGQSLHRITDRFRSRGGLTPALSLRIIIDALSGLHYAHELTDFDGRPLEIVHRDITPQNLFVTYEGQTKLVDFGIAKAFDSSTETRIGTVKGKVAYMAPEQARGEVVDRRADIFSMGVVLWELLAGRRLWEGLPDIAVVGRLVQGEIPDLRALCPHLPPALTRACMRALHPNPAERPQTAAAFGAELEAHLGELSVSLPSRRIGELLREAFTEERAHVRRIIRRQLEKISTNTPTSITPPGGWKLPSVLPGELPLPTLDSSVHEAVTTLHTNVDSLFPRPETASHFTSSGTRTGFQSYPSAFPPESSAPPSSLSRSSFSSTGSTTITTGMTGVTVVQQNRNIVWVALAAVGVAGLAIGMTRPWTHWGAEKTAENMEISQEARSPAAAPPSPAGTHSPGGCQATHKPLVELSGEISQDATLTCDKEYLLRFTTTVTPGTTLTIQPGTTLLGDTETKGVLLVQPGARLVARGTPDAPIVFTSDKPPGQRKAGDWGGVIILGMAPTNLQDAQGRPSTGRVEGISSGGEYGGSNPDDSSGVLSYIRIEYSGTEIAPNNEVNGLTFAGVGRGTVVDHIQVRHTADDCFEFFGGTVDAKYLICQHPDDDAFDWDYGYTGRLQFLVAQSEPSAKEGAHGFEGDNDPRGSANEPISAPLIYNATLCGKNRTMESKEHYGMLLRRGTHGRFRNLIVTGYSAALDVQDSRTRPNIAASVFFNNLVYNLAYPENSNAKRTERLLYDDDEGFDERAYLLNPGLHNSEKDPQIGNCSDLHAPSFKPLSALTHQAAAPPEDNFFDRSAQFIGAFRDRSDNWDEGAWVVWGE